MFIANSKTFMPFSSNLIPKFLLNQLTIFKTNARQLVSRQRFVKIRSRSEASQLHYLVRSSVSVFHFEVRLLDDAVEVFVQAVEQEGEQLLRIVLLVARELRREAAHLQLD